MRLLDESLLKSLSGYPTALLFDASGQGALPSKIKPVSPTFRFCGPAVTIQLPPGNNLCLHRAIYRAMPGDILIASTGSQYEFGYWGEIMTHAAMSQSIGGVIIDGCVRDGSQLKKLNLPIFSRGLCIRTTGKKEHPSGKIGIPIRIGEVMVYPGDVLIGDEDGVIVIPSESAREVLKNAERKKNDENNVIQKIHNGAKTIDILSWSAQ